VYLEKLNILFINLKISIDNIQILYIIFNNKTNLTEINMETTTPPPARRWVWTFFPIWTGQAFSLLGSQLVQFALVWWLTRTTGSATVLAIATLAAMLPQVLLSPLAGALIDRTSRRTVMIIADGIVAAATLALAALFALGLAQVWAVYLMLFGRAAAGAFHYPAMQAATSLMVPKEHLARVQGLNQMLMGAMSIIAAPLGALLLELLPMQGVLAVDVTTALIAVLPLLFVRIPEPARVAAASPGETRPSLWQDFGEGLRYVRAWPGLLLLMCMAALINFLLTPASALTPLLVTRHFQGQAFHLAALESAIGIGVIAGGLFLGVWGGFKRRIVTSMAGLIGIGAGALLLGLTPASTFWLAVAAMFVLGFANPVTNGPLLAAVQAAVAPEMQGRVFTLIMSVAGAMAPLGLLLGGPLADAFGVRFWYILGGAGSLAMALAAFLTPAVIHLEDGRPGASVAPPLPAQPLPADAPAD
jgi:DHA3 family macrolide efflux protein-like MFS transporter